MKLLEKTPRKTRRAQVSRREGRKEGTRGQKKLKGTWILPRAAELRMWTPTKPSYRRQK